MCDNHKVECYLLVRHALSNVCTLVAHATHMHQVMPQSAFLTLHHALCIIMYACHT